jgi:hypothetical protein
VLASVSSPEKMEEFIRSRMTNRHEQNARYFQMKDGQMKKLAKFDPNYTISYEKG